MHLSGHLNLIWAISTEPSDRRTSSCCLFFFKTFFYILFLSATAVLLRESDRFLLGSVPSLHPLFELAFPLCMCVTGGMSFFVLLFYPNLVFFPVCVDYDCLVYLQEKRGKGIDRLHQNQNLTHISAISFILCISRKEQTILSPVNCWNLLLLQVKRESRDHATLSDLYLNNIIPRFAQISEDSGRLFKKVTHIHSRISVMADLFTDCELAEPQAKIVNL